VWTWAVGLACTLPLSPKGAGRWWRGCLSRPAPSRQTTGRAGCRRACSGRRRPAAVPGRLLCAGGVGLRPHRRGGLHRPSEGARRPGARWPLGLPEHRQVGVPGRATIATAPAVGGCRRACARPAGGPGCRARSGRAAWSRGWRAAAWDAVPPRPAPAPCRTGRRLRCADLGDGDLVVVVERVQAAGVQQRGPAAAREAELGDPLVGPAGHDRLARPSAARGGSTGRAGGCSWRHSAPSKVASTA
jgi:hypothetical protein